MRERGIEKIIVTLNDGTVEEHERDGENLIDSRMISGLFTIMDMINTVQKGQEIFLVNPKKEVNIAESGLLPQTRVEYSLHNFRRIDYVWEDLKMDPIIETVKKKKIVKGVN